jgi:rhodanese-related sulfurtransferase
MLSWKSASQNFTPSKARRWLQNKLLVEGIRSLDEIQISPVEVKTRMDRGEKLMLVDVRELWEYELCRIEGAKLVPLGSLAANVNGLLGVDEVICYCHHGMRSLDAATWLRFQGIEKAKSLSGGIERWSTDVDPHVPRY